MNFLQTIKPGDLVVVDQCQHRRSQSLAKVDKVTSTQITVGNQRFTRTSGTVIGHGQSYRKPFLREATPEMASLIRRRVMASNLERAAAQMTLDDRNLPPLEVLEAMLAPYAAHRGAQ